MELQLLLLSHKELLPVALSECETQNKSRGGSGDVPSRHVFLSWRRRIVPTAKRHGLCCVMFSMAA